MRIAIAQINPTVGDFRLNSKKILSFAQRAKEKDCSLVIFSELCLFGYPPNDLLEREHLVDEQLSVLKGLHAEIPSQITIIGGAVRRNKIGKPFYNSAFVMSKGKVIQWADKQLLPSYDIFDETRFFQGGEKTNIFKIPKIGRVAVTICEDMWARHPQRGLIYGKVDPFKSLTRGKADLIVNISASPFSLSQNKTRLNLASGFAQKAKVPFVYVNQVGAQDEIIFDGESFVLDERGKPLVMAASFEEDLWITDLGSRKTEFGPHVKTDIEKIHAALVLGIRDFATKIGIKRVHLGLSGGIDSAVVAALAVDALGPEHVTGLLLPGPYSSKGSIEDSLRLAKNLKIQTHTFSINKEFESLMEEYSKAVPQENLEYLSENLQARLRGLRLMAFSNGFNSMLLMTTNKSELTPGYGTIYGDLIGGLAPIGDLTKKWVYALARHYNSGGREVIPQSIIDKEPSAELKPGQKDSDTLPPYEELDKIVEHIVEQKKPARNKTERWVLEMLFKNEFKRWQAPPILKVTDRAFGRGRRFPIVNKAKN